jgi:predicted  nucleic acid-binding Zn-ribbon protein
MNPPQRTGTVQFQEKDKDASYLDSSPRKLPSSSQGTKIYSDGSKIISTADCGADDFTDHKSERSAKSSAYTPSRNAMMKAGWFGVLDNSVSSANDISAANIPSSRPKAILEVEVEEEAEDEETRFNSRADHQPQKRLPRFSLPKGRSDMVLSLVPSQPMSPLQSPMRLIQHPKPTWNVDSSTQTGSSLKLNGRKSRPKISKECKSCVIT